LTLATVATVALIGTVDADGTSAAFNYLHSGSDWTDVCATGTS